MNVVIAGEGPPLLLVHGSAADHTTWNMQLATLKQHARMITWDRRAVEHVEQHADDAISLIERDAGGPVVACGSSFGGVVVLELARRRPELLRGAVLLEPPLRPDDSERGIPEAALSEYDRLAREQGGPAAAEFFLRFVLGDVPYERMPRPYQERSKSLWRQIRLDCAALGNYRVRYPELGRIDTPILLVGGERSAPFYRPTLEALHAALGKSHLEFFSGAGHMMHAEVYRRFNERLLAFMDTL
jgi:pimeloyl-ACP methyl ester carboxylesterase